VRGVVERAPAPLRRIVVSAVEYSAVLEAARLAAGRGFSVTRVACTPQGRVESERFLAQLGPDVALAALQWANNETGVLQPVDEVGRACRGAGIPFLVDAVQAVGRVAVDGWRAHADLLALSAHKLGGPPGVGALVVRDGIVLAPLIGGGAQERRRRGGTEAVAAIAGFGAVATAVAGRVADEAERLLRMRARLETQIRQRFPDVRLHGQGAPRLPSTLSFALPDVSGEVLAIALDLAGVAVSTGSACASGAVEPSHVMLAMGCDELEARGTIRVSMGWSTAPEDVECFLETLGTVVERVRAGAADARFDAARRD
jgi:cysteine desulfurase